jgi:hypothetical protein
MKMTAPLLKFSATAICLFAVACRLSAQIEVTSAGVGVGTTTPGASLDVQIPGNTLGVRIQNDAAATARLLAVSAGSASWSNGNGVAQFTVGSTSATGRVLSIINNGTGDSLYIDHLGASGNSLIVTGGKVGLGTASPAAKLHLLGGPAGGAGAPQLVQRIESPVVVVGDGPKLEFGWSGNNGAAIWAYALNSHQADLVFGTNYGSATPGERMRVRSDGNVGIGTTTPGYKLEVAGSVRATSFISNSTTYADFVFKPGYKLASLTEVEAAIQRDGHLPGIPSEAEALEHGIDLAAMQVKLLQKIEELTLHVIALEKRTRSLEAENARLKNQQ